ncbi:hypothetical protein DET61_11647 [Marinobacter nauticus]|jgi:signal transduction histidine kinase|uniref:Uncharacterized protein n=1 Tax=Marinobacter nauticus TaxID=2743 RepID=A0A368X9U2_MARNT|nr:hypothetical protein [Marinobacter nauticus]RCW64006.1 hypothetical protein DET61_11647 [Marinobacter nauticus]|tara:strand:+ start:1805 stop:2032 length:228 start_codon:yes stop_codon:yes gene_type:complete
MPDSLFHNMDKTQLSNLADLIRSGMDDLGNSVLSLKPHELAAEGYSQADVADAKDKFEFGNAVLVEILALMENKD